MILLEKENDSEGQFDHCRSKAMCSVNIISMARRLVTNHYYWSEPSFLSLGYTPPKIRAESLECGKLPGIVGRV